MSYDGPENPDSTGTYPTEDEVVRSLAELEEHQSPFLGLFSPRAKAAIIDALLDAAGEPKTVSELTEMNEHVTTSSFHRHHDELETYGVIVRCGKRGNAQTYAINSEHPLVQTLKMIENVILTGQTPILLEEEYIGTPGEEE